MKMKLKVWLFFILSGVCFGTESTDAEILKDLDFFMSYDMIGEDVEMDEDLETVSPTPGVSNDG